MLEHVLKDWVKFSSRRRDKSNHLTSPFNSDWSGISLKIKDISYRCASESEIEQVETALKNSIFVIPSINGGNLLSAMLPTLSIPPSQIIVLDQGSTDSTYQVCESYHVEIVQLAKPHTYTQCCNLALDIAKKRGAEYLYIANNDIVFVTDVARELIYEMMHDSSLGAVSCSQVIPLPDDENGILSHRVYWDLSRTEFEHDRSIPSGDVYRLESDFCEMTCALIRTQAASEIGGFDDEFGFYHEDADFGLRLREAGYTTAYLPQSQIKHFAGSTFSQGKSETRIEYIKNSRKIFTKKHLGFGLKYIDHHNDVATSWNIINQNLYPYMKRYGLVDHDRPELLFAHPGIKPGNCLYSVWETTKLPADWLKHTDDYKSTYLPSNWNLDVFKAAGYQRAHYVPLGVETDVFQPWGKTERQYDGPTFLWFARTQYRKGYDVMLKAWHAFRIDHPDAMLIVCGHGALPEGSRNRVHARQWRKFLRYDDMETQVSYRETLIPLTSEELAGFYRSVDFLVLTSRSEGFGFSVVEAMACGVLSIFPSYGATADMIYEGAITFGGREVVANYSDKDFSDVGHWWEPDPADVLHAMKTAIDMSAPERKMHFRRALNLVRTNFTWRNTCLAIRSDLKNWQAKKDVASRYDAQISMKDESIVDFAKRIELLQSTGSKRAPNTVTEIDIESSFIDFDREYYLYKNRDLEIENWNPLHHYLFHGWKKGQNPSASVDTRSYIALNPDVRRILGCLNNLGFGYDKDVVAAGVAAWQIRMLDAVADDQTNTDEFFLDILYKTALNRAPDPEGLRHYLKLLNLKPRAKKQLTRQMFSSPERAKVFPFEPAYPLPLIEPNSQIAVKKRTSWFGRKGAS